MGKFIVVEIANIGGIPDPIERVSGFLGCNVKQREFATPSVQRVSPIVDTIEEAQSLASKMAKEKAFSLREGDDARPLDEGWAYGHDYNAVYLIKENGVYVSNWVYHEMVVEIDV